MAILWQAAEGLERESRATEGCLTVQVREREEGRG